MTDYEDYENNLAFPPTTDRTQSKEELVEKIEKLSKQLEIAVKGIRAVLDDDFFCETADGGLVMYLYTALERMRI